MLKIINGGIEVLVEDWPGRLGYLGKGMSASGAFDNVGLGLANVLVGNPSGEAGLEITGGFLEAEFTGDHVIALAGTDMQPTINGQPVAMWTALKVSAGDVIKFLHIAPTGFRCYLAVAGGVDVPAYLGSKSTCIFGAYGGFDGRALKPGDEVKFGASSADLSALAGRKLKAEAIPQYSNEWVLRAIPGPNTCPDYATQEGMDLLFSRVSKIQHTSNRSAYRLEELPASFFARADGGVGGSHPSNIIDHAYAIRGALNICGNTPILLVADGPTLGGYMCALNVINADLWKVGQGAPGRDYMQFQLSSQEEAIEERKKQKQWLSEDSLA
ncbi:MAG: biotin-dependent carboxyltransferase family protein [Proteobacteria bacterium]|nr:biotin-dependent carboxyltransferase family protein [Pseudomonadota bacterium]MBU1452412.1 biotin-dependent carboxyltransferase family protein [Pseudomonadota bacterium]MBU2467679.1 biotin-dependent carboxyltransferase family protein [Pseudomonadota bacterium]MBU2518231.1 biotin-dependent carboxyltransferase family protein [Pseudomonadota bacterium]